MSTKTVVGLWKPSRSCTFGVSLATSAPKGNPCPAGVGLDSSVLWVQQEAVKMSAGGSERGIGELPAHLFPWLVLNALLGFAAAHAHLLGVYFFFFTRYLNSFCSMGGSPVPGCTGTSTGTSGTTSPITRHCLVL